MEFFSQTTTKLLTAICEFNKQDLCVEMSGENPRFKNKHIKLKDLVKIKPIMAQYKLVPTNHTIHIGEQLYLVTRVNHCESGEWMQSMFPISLQEFTAQNMGSWMTYGERYNLVALLFLTGDDKDDDDGEEASRKPAAHPRPEKKVDIKGSDDYQKLKNSVSATGANMKHFDDYMNDLSERKGIPVIHLASEAMTRAGLIDIVIKQYSDFLAKKSKAA